MIWRGGCIIRAQFLHRIKEAFDRDADLANLLPARTSRKSSKRPGQMAQGRGRQATKLGMPVPAFSSALAYFDSYRREQLPANLIQAQRDYFGAHTYGRVDKKGVFHTEWTT